MRMYSRSFHVVRLYSVLSPAVEVFGRTMSKLAHSMDPKMVANDEQTQVSEADLAGPPRDDVSIRFLEQSDYYDHVVAGS